MTRSTNDRNSSLLETGSVSQPTPTIDAGVALDERGDEPFRRRPVGSLDGRRHALLPQQGTRGVHVARGFLQRSLAIHHPRAR